MAEEPSVDADPAADITVISSTGDLLLEAVDEKRKQTCTYRVDIDRIRKASSYFERLLDPKKFGEGTSVATQLQYLTQSYGHVSDIPVKNLPRVRVSDVGKTSNVSSIVPLMRDFLKVLHGQDIIGPLKPGALVMPLLNIANLAVVADRFDALPHTAAYIRRKHILEGIDAKVSQRKPSKATEGRLRQRLLVGILFEHPAWTLSASQALIISGSERWKADVSIDEELPLWWDLPQGLEDELISRRDYVVDTVQSIVLHFLAIYSSGTQQCRLGYDNSWICDSFSLGAMTKFFRKHQLVRFGPILTGQNEEEPYTGDIDRILDALKSCPADRMDQYHNHCGLRTRLVPLIEQLEPLIRASSAYGVGICGDCWQTHRLHYAWKEAKRPVAWRPPIPRSIANVTARLSIPCTCMATHAKLRDMFMAVDRDWTPKEERSEGMRFGMAKPSLRHD